MTTPSLQARLSQLPAVTAVLDAPTVAALVATSGRQPVVNATRRVLEEARDQLRQAADAPVPAVAELAEQVVSLLASQQRPHLRRVLNGTGIVLHTGLGRAPLAAEAVAAMEQVARYCNVETDLDSGRRSHRQDCVRDLLCELTGAEAATVVNNNAAATMLTLRALAADREVIVSRGQLIEIGGSFRLPDIMATSGARLREVGTTNRTHLRDYEGALSEHTAALLRVHSSNYRVVGFTTQPTLPELVALARRAGVWMIDDVGSGALFDMSELVGPEEPVVAQSVTDGADVVLFSGDKLLGGPQAGLVVGRAECIERLERDPLMRAVRMDKLLLAALEATLRLYRDPDLARQQLPLQQLLRQTPEQLKRRAQSLRRRLRRALPALDTAVAPTESYVGGGSVPGRELPSWSVALVAPERSADDLARALRLGDPALFARVERDRLLLDLRALLAGEEREVVEALARAVQ